MGALRALVPRLEIAAAVTETAAGTVIVAEAAAVFRGEQRERRQMTTDWRTRMQPMTMQPMASLTARPVCRASEVQVWEFQAMVPGTAECRAFSPQRRPRPESFLPSPDATAASR